MSKFIDSPKYKFERRFLRPGDFMEIAFTPQKGEVIINTFPSNIAVLPTAPVGPPTSAFAAVVPTIEDSNKIVHPDLEIPHFVDVPPDIPIEPTPAPKDILVELFSPDANKPVASLVTIGSPERDALQQQVKAKQAGKRWKCRFTNQGTQNVGCLGQVFFIFSQESPGRLFKTAIPFSLLNHAASQFLKMLGLDIEVVNGNGKISVSRQITELSGGKIKSRSFDASKDFFFFEAGVDKLTLDRIFVKTLQSKTGRPIIRIFIMLSAIEAGIDIFTPVGEIDIDLIEREKMAVRIDLILFTVGQEDKRGIDYEVSVRANDFLMNFFFGNIPTRSMNKADVKALARFRELLKKFGDRKSKLEEKIESIGKDLLEDLEVRQVIGKFLTEGFTQLAQRGHKFYSISANQNNILIEHYAPKKGVDLGPFTTGKIKATGGGPAFGNLPGRENLDKIDHIVFLMMENRSFDHMLGYLSLHGGRNDVDGLTGNERNLTSGPPVTIGQLKTKRFSFDPPHDFKGVNKQIADGEMSGFVDVFRDHNPLVNPDAIMGYYRGRQVPTYDFFSKHFLLCDRWFSSHPGPTQPNRFCTFSGTTPFLENLKIDDPGLSYLRFLTIFDSLTALDIDWVYYESDVAFLRMMDRYRLDVKNIIPLHDKEEGFFERVKHPGIKKLPPVTFIDPNFVDVPIGRVSNDDHPPSNIASGQRFIARIYNALRKSPIWEKTLFVITYDEHGGFFDHVPPPGTKVWNKDPKNAQIEVAKVHPDGRNFLGARVPAFVISPWVQKEAVSSTIFDHTSIIKTILLKFRKKDFPDFGPRVAQAEHLGTLLTRSEPRKNIPEIKFSSDHDDSEGLPGGFKPDRSDPRDFHLAMENFGKPLLPLTV